MKIVVDANIILDFLKESSDARKLFSLICEDKAEAYATAGSIADIYYITTKKLGENSSREIIKKLLKIIGIISISGDDCADALNLPISDLEDALVVACASKENIDYIVTDDNDFLHSTAAGINVISLSNFLSLNQQ